MRWWLAAMLVILPTVVACRDQAPAPPRDSVAAVEAVREQMCRCKAGDAACAEKVLVDWTRVAGELAADTEASPERQAKLTELGQEIDRCRARATGEVEASPAAPPPAP